MKSKAPASLPGKIYNSQVIQLLFWTCWAAYFISYIGRLNYAASMVEIGDSMGYSNGMLGLVTTIIFASYGGGQLVSGVLGDHFSPKILALIGISVSGLCNLAAGSTESFPCMAVFLGINGLAQSLIWSPMVRIFSMYIPEEKLYKSLINIQSSCALGTCVTYVLAAGLISMWNWRAIFWIAGALLVGAAVWWQFALSKVENYSEKYGKVPVPVQTETASPAEKTMGAGRLFLISGVLTMILPTIAMGMLRDGVMTWVPEYTATTFGSSNALSVFLTALLPLFNLSGAYVITPMYKKITSEPTIAAIMFAAAGVSIVLLMLFGNQSLLLTILLFSIITSAMTGCNTAIVSLMPTYFVRWGRTSTAVGVLNAFCYVGSALSGGVIGLLSEKAGWSAAQILWLVLCGLALALCILVVPVWKKFKQLAAED